jgi:protein-L-isoaspartate O-methyltransferase
VTALAHARSTAETLGVNVAKNVDWVEGDLSSWTPQPAQYDLVLSLYVHVADSVEAMVQRLAAGVAPGGTLFLVGHRPIDPTTGSETAAALDPNRWTLVVAEDRPRPIAGTGVDAVIRAQRNS